MGDIYKPKGKNPHSKHELRTCSVQIYNEPNTRNEIFIHNFFSLFYITEKSSFSYNVV